MVLKKNPRLLLFFFHSSTPLIISAGLPCPTPLLTTQPAATHPPSLMANLFHLHHSTYQYSPSLAPPPHLHYLVASLLSLSVVVVEQPNKS